MMLHFARAFRAPKRAIPEDDAREPGPPEAFVETVPDEGGTLYVAPMVDALRNVLRRAREQAAGQDGGPSPSAPQDAKVLRPRDSS